MECGEFELNDIYFRNDFISAPTTVDKLAQFV